MSFGQYSFFTCIAFNWRRPTMPVQPKHLPQPDIIDVEVIPLAPQKPAPVKVDSAASPLGRHIDIYV